MFSSLMYEADVRNSFVHVCIDRANPYIDGLSSRSCTGLGESGELGRKSPWSATLFRASS